MKKCYIELINSSLDFAFTNLNSSPFAKLNFLVFTFKDRQFAKLNSRKSSFPWKLMLGRASHNAFKSYKTTAGVQSWNGVES